MTRDESSYFRDGAAVQTLAITGVNCRVFFTFADHSFQTRFVDAVCNQIVNNGLSASFTKGAIELA